MRSLNRIREELEAAALRYAITGERAKLDAVCRELRQHHERAEKQAATDQTAEFEPLDPRAVSFAA